MFRNSKKTRNSIVKYIWQLADGNNKIKFKTAIEARDLNIEGLRYYNLVEKYTIAGYFPFLILLICLGIVALRELLIEYLDIFDEGEKQVGAWTTYVFSVFSVVGLMCLSSICGWVYARIIQDISIYSARNMERLKIAFSISSFTFFLLVLISFKIEIALNNSQNNESYEEEDLFLSIISILLTAIVIVGVWPIIKMLFKFAFRKRFKMRMQELDLIEIHKRLVKLFFIGVIASVVAPIFYFYMVVLFAFNYVLLKVLILKTNCFIKAKDTKGATTLSVSKFIPFSLFFYCVTF